MQLEARSKIQNRIAIAHKVRDCVKQHEFAAANLRPLLLLLLLLQLLLSLLNLLSLLSLLLLLGLLWLGLLLLLSLLRLQSVK